MRMHLCIREGDSARDRDKRLCECAFVRVHVCVNVRI